MREFFETEAKTEYIRECEKADDKFEDNDIQWKRAMKRLGRAFHSKMYVAQFLE